MENKNIIIFSSIDWTTHRQLHHELVENLIKDGNRILFIENVGSRSFKLRDFFRIKKRILDWFNSNRGYLNIDKSLTVYSPVFFPFNFFKPFVSINSLILSNSIIKWLKIVYFDSPIVISFLPSPLVYSIINKINPQLKIYYCADLMFKPKISPTKIKKWEIKFLNFVDHSFYTSLKIGDYINKNTDKKNSTYIPNGVNFNRFKNFEKYDLKKELKLLDLPNIGFVGAIRSVLDYKLLEFLIKNIRANFIFIGPIFDKKYLKLSKYLNCFFLGNRDYKQIPNFINNFDVCIIPYLKNDFTDAIYPVKLNEYLSLGKNVVTTNIDELIEFNKKNKIIYISYSREEFKKNIEKVILDKKINNISVNRIKSIAENNSWDKRFQIVKKIINKKLDVKKKNTDNWSSFSKQYKYKIFKSFSKYISILVFIYFIIFISPFYWLLGNQLTVKNKVSNHEVAIILSGTRETNFLDQNYQDRVISAINYYNQNKVDKIFISSGYVQNNYGILFIKNLLETKGIAKDDYIIDEIFPKTTYDVLVNIYSYLHKKNFKNVVIFTDNYHSKRVDLIWNNKFKNISNTIIVDKKLNEKKWNIGLNEIGKINYEYLAIIYNYLLNRI